MTIFKCEDYSNLECTVVVDSAAAMVAHLKGSHGINSVESDFTSAEEAPAAEEPKEEVDYRDLKYRDLVSFASKAGVYRAGMKKVAIIEALEEL